MSDKFKPYRQDKRPKKFKEGNFSDFGDNKKAGITKQERKFRRDNSWKREFIYRGVG